MITVVESKGEKSAVIEWLWSDPAEESGYVRLGAELASKLAPKAFSPRDMASFERCGSRPKTNAHQSFGTEA